VASFYAIIFDRIHEPKQPDMGQVTSTIQEVWSDDLLTTSAALHSVSLSGLL